MRRIAWILFLCVTLVGCSKNNAVIPPVEPPVTIIQPKVELSITPNDVVLPYGSKVVIKWTATGSNYCLFNTEIVSIDGMKEAQLFTDASYSVIAVSGTIKSTPAEKVIKVGDWTTSKLGLITYDGAPWMMKHKRTWQDGNLVFDAVLGAFDQTTKYYFMLDGHIRMVEASGESNSSGTWSFSNNETSLVNGKEVYLIEKLKKDEFTISIATTWYGKPAIFQLTYSRPGIK